jgi:hypothetical protein
MYFKTEPEISQEKRSTSLRCRPIGLFGGRVGEGDRLVLMSSLVPARH